jgi:hypothetical protein
MREIEELFADSGEPVRITRGTALKVGGLGLAGAVAALLPGRASSAVRKRSTVQSCSSFPSTTCGQGPITCDSNQSCSCITVFRKLHKVGASMTVCAQGKAGNFACNTLTPCPQGTECDSNHFCADPNSTCCTRAVCVPKCGACAPTGNGLCASPKTCGGFVFGCSGNGSCTCYQTPEGVGGCGPSVPCNGTPCSSSCDCPSGSFCAINSCCSGGICIPNCSGGTAPAAKAGVLTSTGTRS